MMRQDITATNSYQSIGSAGPGKVNVVGNLSFNDPTIKQLNDAISEGGQQLTSAEGEPIPGIHFWNSPSR